MIFQEQKCQERFLDFIFEFITMKRKYYPIPFSQLSEGIKLCIKNCKRYYSESLILEKHNHDASAMISLIIAIEECAKAAFLLDYYKIKQDIPQNKVKEVFSNHKIRLAKFYELEDRSLEDISSIPSVHSEETRKIFNKMKGELQQFGKVSMMYVDWTKHYWHDPLKHLEIISMDNGVMNDDEWRMLTKSHYKSLKRDLKLILEIIQKDKEYDNAVSTISLDNISNDKIIDMIRKKYSELDQFAAGFTPDTNQIKIKIVLVKNKTNEDKRIQLQKEIENRFGGFSAEIKLVESI